MMKRLLRSGPVQAMLAALIGRYLEFALASTRWTLHGAEHLAPFMDGTPAIFAFWHERLPLMPALWRHARRIATQPQRARILASRHADGRFLGAIMEHFGVRAVHGSTTRNGRDRGGAAGLRNLLAALESREHVALTPDGPRGPARAAAPGVAYLAALSGVRIVPCAAQVSRRRALPTWDRMVLPLPFGRGVIVCGPPLAVARDGPDAALPAIQAAMTAAATQADALCPK